MKAALNLVFLWIFVDYLTHTSVDGQTIMISIDNRTFPVCTSTTCDSSGCGNPFGVPVPACSCDYGCEFFGDCCIDYTLHCKQATPDGPMTSAGNNPISFEDATRLLDRSHVTCVTLPQETEHYWMVSSCPKSWKNDLVKTRCEDYPLMTDLDFAIVPVSHGEAMSYKNVFCALCNGLNQNEITPWKLELLCSQSLTDLVLSGKATLSELYQSGECTSSIQPPSDSSPSCSRKCLASEILDDCPIGSDQDVSVLCTSYQDLVRNENDTTFRNPYCKLCNTVPGVSLNGSQEYITNICLDSAGTTAEPSVDRRPTKPTPRRWGRVTPTSGDRGIINPDVNALQPLSIIMDFSRDSRVQVVHSENVIKEVDISCHPWEVFDPFLQECLTLSCANGYELRDNVCHRLTPPLNITCGADDTDLKLVVSATIGLGQPMDIKNCDPTELNRNVTQFIENTLDLPSGNLRSLDGSNSAADDEIRLMSDDGYSKCQSFLNDSLRMDYVVESGLMTFSQLEELADRTLLQYTTTPLVDSEYHILSLTISQQCISVSGLSQCPGGLKLLTNANVSRVENFTVVMDEKTGDIYHSYETVFTASYERDSMASGGNYGKTLNIQVCEQIKLLTCSLITQPASLFSPLDGSSLNNTLTGQILRPDDYTLTANGSVQYCAPENFGRNATFNQTTVIGIFAYDEAQIILSFVGVSLSLVSLLITFATYCIFPHMRRCVSNKLIMVLCVVLFVAQLLQMISGLGTSISELCTTLSVLSHFLWTSVFAITTCLAFELNRTLGARDSFTVSTDSQRAMVTYMLFTLLTASFLVGSCLAIHFTVGEELNFSYGSDDVCWIVNQVANLLAFGCPLGVFLIINTILFVHTVAGIRNASKVRRTMLMESQSIKDTVIELRVYLKISTLLGFTWSFGFVAGFAGISALWYVFIILNSLQGFYIFLAFIANRRVYSMWATCLCHCNTSGSLTRHSRGTSSIPFSQRMSRMTSVSSLPRTSEYASNTDRRHSGEKGTGSHRYSTASQKVKSDRISSVGICKDSGGDRAETNSDRESPSGIRRYSHGEWKYVGERKQSGDRKYQTASDWRNVNGGKSVKH